MANHIQKHESSRGDRTTSPEKDLWVAVLGRALLDAFQQPPNLNLSLRMNKTHDMYFKYNRDQARHFFLNGGEDFKIICELAGRNYIYVQQKIRKILLRKNGWNVDVPVTSHYRQGSKTGKPRGRPKKKKLTGNSYYAFIGKKGGRPRIYNKLSTT